MSGRRFVILKLTSGHVLFCKSSHVKAAARRIRCSVALVWKLITSTIVQEIQVASYTYTQSVWRLSMATAKFAEHTEHYYKQTYVTIFVF